MQVESVDIHIQLYDLYSQPACPDSAIPPQEPLNAPLFPAQVCPTLKGQHIHSFIQSVRTPWEANVCHAHCWLMLET